MVRVTALIVVCVGLLAGCAAEGVEATIYGDGDVTCPNHWAQDESLPVGTVTFRPTNDGLDIEVDLTDAAPNWTYNAEVLPADFCETGTILAGVIGELLTDDTGAGRLEVSVPVEPGAYELTVNVVSEPNDNVPEDPRLREMSPSGLTEVVVP